MEDVKERETSYIFWTTIVISFVLLVHNGTEPLFLFALSSIAFIIIVFLWKKNLWPVLCYLLLIGVLGRYGRYVRESYASDTILALRDFIGYFLAGKNVYAQHTMATTGKVPFTYLPFALFWYLPSYLFSFDYRLFEVGISSVNLLIYLAFIKLTNTIKFTPIFAILSLTPFLLDLSADGSTDNSAVFLLIFSVLLFILAVKKKNRNAATASAIIFGLANAFKHYVWFFTFFFIPYLMYARIKFPIAKKNFLLISFIVFAGITLPFVLAAPKGFWESLTLIEMRQGYRVWGWNIWSGLQLLGMSFSKQQIWLTRTIMTIGTGLGLILFFQPKTLQKVFIASAVTLLMYLMFSVWTTYAYFTFLVPLFALAAIEEI